MVGEELRKALLSGCFQSIVQFFSDPGFQLRDERFDFQTFEQHTKQLREHRRVREIGGDGLLDTGVLHFDSNTPPIVKRGLMDLADGGGCQWSAIPRTKQRVWVYTQLVLDDRSRKIGCHRRSIILQGCQLRP
jgi:hypothetical protein